MKATLGFCLSLIALVCVSVLSPADERGKGPVMGLKRPGKVPEVFMPDRIPGPGGGETDLRLLVTFREGNSAWSEPADLGAALGMNPPIRFPSLSPDEDVLFIQKNNKVYWVDAGIIASLQRK